MAELALRFTAGGILLETCVYMFLIGSYNIFLSSIASELESGSHLLT